MLGGGEAVNFPKFRDQMLSMPDIPFVDSSTHSSSALIISAYTLLPTDVRIKADCRCLHIEIKEPHYQAAKECEELRPSIFLKIAQTQDSIITANLT